MQIANSYYGTIGGDYGSAANYSEGVGTEHLEITEELTRMFQSGAVEEKHIVEAFNPANAATIPDAVMQFMEHLTNEQLKALATAYPNKPTGNAYLVLKDTNLKTGQLYPRSTWQNLYNLRVMSGQKNWAAISFASRFKANKVQASTLTKSPFQDLKPTEVASAAGLKKAPEQTLQPKQETVQQPQQPAEEFPDISPAEVENALKQTPPLQPEQPVQPEQPIAPNQATAPVEEVKPTEVASAEQVLPVTLQPSQQQEPVIAPEPTGTTTGSGRTAVKASNTKK